MILHDFISNANNPQLGSFGEAIFYDFVSQLNLPIDKLHYARTDFKVKDQRFDVKTTKASIHKVLTNPKLSFRNRVPNVNYAGIEFHVGGILLSIEGNLIEQLSWGKIEHIYNNWRSGYYGKAHILKDAIKNVLSEELKSKVHNIFNNLNINRPYLLFRTVEFDGESPHNLLPSQRRNDKRLGWTVFLIFKNSPPTEENIEKIISFPDSSDFEIQRLSKIRTGTHIKSLEKADLKKIPRKFISKNLNDLQHTLTKLTTLL